MKRKPKTIDVTPTTVEVEDIPKPRTRKAQRIKREKIRQVSVAGQIDEYIEMGEMIEENVETLTIGYLASLFGRR